MLDVSDKVSHAYQDTSDKPQRYVDALSYFINAFSIFFINIPLGTETPSERKATRYEIKYAVDPLYDVTTSSYSAKIIPDEIRGRVTSLTRLVVLGAYSFGFFITGNLLQYLESRWTIGIFSMMLLLLFVATAKNRNLADTTMSRRIA